MIQFTCHVKNTDLSLTHCQQSLHVATEFTLYAQRLTLTYMGVTDARRSP